VTEPTLIRGLTAGGDLAGCTAVLIEDGRIRALDGDAEDAGADRVLDARGLVAVPGFVELQLNGAFGHDFTTEPASIWSVGDGLARHGITSFLPTIVSSPAGSVDAALEAWAAAPSQPSGAVPLGLHVEGPFLSPARAGAHPAEHLRDPDLDEIRRWAASGGLRLLTLAPELPGALDAVAALVEAGVVVAIGHTDADAPTATAAVDRGATYATHLFNAMPPFAHRAPGAAAALLVDERVTVGLIIDRHHLDPITVAMVERLAHGRISLVSDAIAALGLEPGSHRLGSRTVVVSDDAARLPDGTLAGSVTPLDACVRGFSALTGAPAEAVAAVTSVPARLLKLADGRGELRVGGRADVVLLDAELEVHATFVGGAVAYAAEDLAWA
jgi:N-acetylglucosamine-6-phosphate deacetylase